MKDSSKKPMLLGAKADGMFCDEMATAEKAAYSLCTRCVSFAWCGCEPGDAEGGCDFVPGVEYLEPPYNLYDLYERVFCRHPKDDSAIDDDEVSELIDGLLDICNSGGNKLIERCSDAH